MARNLDDTDGILFDSRPDDPNPTSRTRTDVSHISLEGDVFDDPDAAGLGVNIVRKPYGYTLQEYFGRTNREKGLLALVEDW